MGRYQIPNFDPKRRRSPLSLRMLPAVALTIVSILVPTIVTLYLRRDHQRWELFRLGSRPVLVLVALVAAALATFVAWRCRDRPLGKIVLRLVRYWPPVLAGLCVIAAGAAIVWPIETPGWLNVVIFGSICSAVILCFRLTPLHPLDIGVQYLSYAVFFILGIISLAGSITLASFLVQNQNNRTETEIARLNKAEQRIREAEEKNWPVLLHDRDAMAAVTRKLSDALVATNTIWPDEDLVRNTTHLGIEDRRKLAEATLSLLTTINETVDSSSAGLLKHRGVGVVPVTVPGEDYRRELKLLQEYYSEIGRAWAAAHARAENMRPLFPEMSAQIVRSDSQRADLLKDLSGYWGTYWIAAMLDPEKNSPSWRTLITIRPGIKGGQSFPPLANLGAWANMTYRDAQRMARDAHVCAGWTVQRINDRYPQRFSLSCFLPNFKEGVPPDFAAVRLDYVGRRSVEVLDSQGNFDYRRWLPIAEDETPRAAEYRFRAGRDKAATVRQLDDAFEAEMSGSAQVFRGRPQEPIRFELRRPTTEAGELTRCEVITLGPPSPTTMDNSGETLRYPLAVKDCRF